MNINNLYFKKFELTSKEKDGFDLTLVGVTSDKRSIVRQIDSLRDAKYNKVIKAVELKSVNEDKFENVNFEIKVSVVINTKDINASTQTPQPNQEREVLKPLNGN